MPFASSTPFAGVYVHTGPILICCITKKQENVSLKLVARFVYEHYCACSSAWFGILLAWLPGRPVCTKLYSAFLAEAEGRKEGGREGERGVLSNGDDPIKWTAAQLTSEQRAQPLLLLLLFFFVCRGLRQTNARAPQPSATGGGVILRRRVQGY